MNYYDNFYEGLNDNRNLLYKQMDTVSSLNKLFTTLSKNKMTPHLRFRAQVPFHCPQHMQYLKV